MDDIEIQTVYRYIVAVRAMSSGTDTQKQILRAYFLSRTPAIRAQLMHQWSPVGQHICKIIASSPWMLHVFLECGYGRSYMTTMFAYIMQSRCVESFLKIIQYEPLAERFAARCVDDTFYKHVWTHYVPQMFGAILDAYLRLEGLIIDLPTFYSTLPSLSPLQMEIILSHPYHRDLIYYKLPPPPQLIDTKNYIDYKYAERLCTRLRAARRATNWRFLFWCAVLHSRMMEFRERYWAINGSRAQAAAADFYHLATIGKN